MGELVTPTEYTFLIAHVGFLVVVVRRIYLGRGSSQVSTKAAEKIAKIMHSQGTQVTWFFTVKVQRIL